MFRGMPVADMHIPVTATHVDDIALFYPREPKRHGSHDIRKIEWPLVAPLLQDRRIHACASVKFYGFGHWPVLLVQHQHAGKQPRRTRRHQLGPVFGLEPTCQTHVVRMVMCDNHPLNRLSTQRARHQTAPNGLATLGRKTGVDHGPASSFIQRVDIHVIQFHWQGKAQP